MSFVAFGRNFGNLTRTPGRRVPMLGLTIPPLLLQRADQVIQ
jgi:hypothetical protein